MPRTIEPKIYTFGDSIPTGFGFYVSYKVVGVPGGMLVGPYDTLDVAEIEASDIRGYDGVSNVKVVPRSDIR